MSVNIFGGQLHMICLAPLVLAAAITAVCVVAASMLSSRLSRLEEKRECEE